jgi:hypothetical protein
LAADFLNAGSNSLTSGLIKPSDKNKAFKNLTQAGVSAGIWDGILKLKAS